MAQWYGIAIKYQAVERSRAMRQGDIKAMVARAISVVQILPELNAGGVERGTVELARFLVDQGHQSMVISQGGTMVDQLVRQGSRHLRMPYIGEKSPRSLLHWFPLRKLFKRDGVDIIHLRSRLPAWIAYMAWKSLPKNHRPCLVTTFHGFYSQNPYSAIMTKGQKVIAISNVVAQHIKSVYHTSSSNIEIIYRGVDIDKFHPDRVHANRVQKIKKKWGLDGKKVPIIVLPGRVTFWKGHDLFVEALAKIKDRKWRAVCVGAIDTTSAYYNRLMKQIDTLNLSHLVTFVGHEVDMPAVYAAADIVVSAATAEAEAFGRVSIEAQAMARPIVASAHGGSLETVIHEQTGWLFAPGDVMGLSTALDQLLSNRDLCRRFGQKGFKRARAQFTNQRMCQRTLHLYRELIQTSS